MTRTTIDIDAPVLKDLKRRQKIEGKSLGRLASELLAESLARYDTEKPVRPAFRWLSKSMGARVNFADKEALFGALEEAPKRRPKRVGKP